MKFVAACQVPGGGPPFESVVEPKMINEKRVMREGKFVLTGGLVIERYRLAFIRGRSDRIYYQQSSAPKTFSRPFRDLKRFIS